MHRTFYLSERASNVQFILRQYNSNIDIPYNEAKYLLENAHILCQYDEYYNLALNVICRISDQKPEDPLIQQLLYDCIVESRIYLYLDMLSIDDSYFEHCSTNSLIDLLARETYTLDTETTLTKPQKQLFTAYRNKRRLVVSAPTSFGKSRIIPEIIAAYKYKNAAVIVPTNALLHETYISLKNNKILNKYKIITSKNQISAKFNIFILTPERMELILDDRHNLSIDFFAMDEIYKINNNDDRSVVFTNCLRRLLKKRPDFYLIGPYFEGFSSKFLKRHDADFVKFDQEVVQKELIDLHDIKSGESVDIGQAAVTFTKSKDTNLAKIVRSLGGQSLVYVSNKRAAESKAKLIAKSSDYTLKSDYIADLIDYIKEHVSDEWSLINYIQKGVSFHHAGLPKFISTEIVEAFNEGKIRTIVCSTTLTEGVNTSAKNVIFSDNEKGADPLTGFDVKNIKGRAGRLGRHFMGRVISLVDLPADEELAAISYAYLDKELLSDEEVALLDDEDIDSGELRQRRLQLIEELLADEIDFEAIKVNKYIPVKKQVDLIMHLRTNPALVDEIYFDGNIPKKYQLELIIGLCFDYIFTEKDKGKEQARQIKKSILIYFAKKYVYSSPSIKELISDYRAVNIDTKVRNVFDLIYNYFEFAFPRYLMAFQNIFNYISERKINLQFLATTFEYGSANEHDIALKEAGVPQPIIRKISQQFRGCKDIDDIRLKFQVSPQISSLLSPFEQRILKRFL